MLLVVLILYARGKVSEYESSKQELALIEDTAKFNEKFTNYDRKGVLGYEIISLVNQVSDYNKRKSNANGSANDEKYNPITVEVNFQSENYVKKLTKDDTIRLFSGVGRTYKYVQSDAIGAFNNIFSQIRTIEARYGSMDNATKIAKGVDTIVPTTGIRNEEEKKRAVKKFNSYSSNVKYTETQYDSLKNNEKEYIYKYCEYIQFKRAKFDSDSSQIVYDNVTGRISKMVFNFTGEIY